MINKHFKSLLTTGCVMAAVVGSASAGGFSRGTADTDILFEQGNFNMRATATIVNPTREIESGPNNLGHDYADTYVVPSAAVKFKLSENLSCAGTMVQVYGGDSTYRDPYRPNALTLGKVNEDFNIMEYGATCGAGFNLSKGRITVLGGVFLENFNYDLHIFGNPGLATNVNIDLQGNSVGWRAGVAYEIPEIALRAQLLYRSSTTVSSNGGVVAAGAVNGTGTASGSGQLPQSVEMKLQSGVAPGWLVFGSVKWTDWSVNETLTLTTSVPPIGSQNLYYWNDGWTVSAGVGHAFNEQVSGTAFLSWDRGVSTGYDLYADVWTFGSGVLLKDSMGGELRLGGAVSYLGSVAETQYVAGSNYAVGSDWSFAASAGYAVKW